MLNHVGDDHRRDQFALRRRDHDGAVVVQVCRAVDVVSAPTLPGHLDAVPAHAPTLVIVDLRRWSYGLQPASRCSSRPNIFAPQGPTTSPVATHGRTTCRLMHLNGIGDETDLCPTLNAARRGRNQ